jgi:hypothetical protein
VSAAGIVNGGSMSKSKNRDEIFRLTGFARCAG